MKIEKKAGAERAQLAVRDEWWSEKRIQSFLLMQPLAGESGDYRALLKAYRGMVPDAFVRFIKFFVEAGRDINAPGPGGKTILTLVQEQRNSAEYSKILIGGSAV